MLFFRGDRMLERRDVALRAIEKGFLVGNHTMTHSVLFRRPINLAVDEIQACDKVLRKLHQEVKRPYLPLFRFPYGMWRKMPWSRLEGYCRYFRNEGTTG
jgi:peptidoglycan/xylan/chitin deacetylase (PgdA/CDA1 family)